MPSVIRGDDNFDSANGGPNAQAGAVGTYAFLRNSVKENLFEGSTRAGSQLAYTCHEAIADSSFSSHGATLGTRYASGTWRLMGYNNHRYSETTAKAASIWLRIA